jgi:hypothetical protein
VFDYPYTPLQGVRVEIEGNGAKYREITDKEGLLKIPTVKPGTYLIRGIFPAQTGITGHSQPSRIKEGKKYTLVEYQEEIKDGRCGYMEILVFSPRKYSERR